MINTFSDILFDSKKLKSNIKSYMNVKFNLLASNFFFNFHSNDRKKFKDYRNVSYEAFKYIILNFL